MNEMFYNCQSLQYLNLYSIKEKEGLAINNIFTGSSENFTFCVKEKENIPTIFNILLNMTITERDCSTNCYDNKKRYYIPSKKLCCTKLTYEDNCYQVCPSKTHVVNNEGTCEYFSCSNPGEYYNYEQNDCTYNISGYYVNDSLLKTIDKCHEDCLECNGKYTKETSNCYKCINSKPYIYLGNCYNESLSNLMLSSYSENENKIFSKESDSGEVIFQITNSQKELEVLKNKSNNIYNISIVDLGDCETILKEKYNINENDSLIFIKNEIKSDKVSEKNIKFDVYNPYNKDKLNLSFCDDTPINIYIPMELSHETKQIYEQMKNSGYDMFNINDPFYQDICTPFDSPDGTDILLSDRINYIYNNDDTQCQPNCFFSEYSIESKYLSCSCSVKEEENNNNFKSDKFNAKKIYESFYEVLKYSNYDIIKCYNIILNIDVIKINMGSIIVLLNFSFYLICLFNYMIKGIVPLKFKLRKELQKKKNIYNKNLKQNIRKLLYPPIKKNFKNKKISIGKMIKFDLKKKSKIDQNIKIYSNSSSRFNVLDKALEKKSIIKSNNMKKKVLFEINNKKAEKMPKREYSNYELNELEYEEAVKYDRRTLCQIYWATLQREHLIIFTFFNCNDYNLLSVKISRFVFLIVGDMALNVFFFSDDSMHKLFLNYGKYDFLQQIPQITYSTIISQIIEVFLCFLSLTDKPIYQIKSDIIKGNIRIMQKIIKCIRIKLIIYFIFIFLFFGIYWYIITIFCGVYRNTQIAFIKDSIISFSICLIYPLILYFFSVCLRICSLRNSKKRFKCLYNFSYIIPFF